MKANAETVSWLTSVPASDLNFKHHLQRATFADCEEALKHVTSKGAIKAIESRMRKLFGEDKHQISPRPAASSRHGGSTPTAPGQVSKALVPAGAKPLTLDTLDMMPPTPHAGRGLKDMTLPELEAIDRGLRGLPEKLEGMSGVCAVLDGLVLAEIKGRMKHGEWQPWLKAQWGTGKRDAQKRMQIAEAFGKSATRGAFEPQQLTLALLDESQSGALDVNHPVVASVAKWTEGRSYRQLLEDETSDGRADNPGGFHPNALILRAWLEETYPDHPEYLEHADCFSELPADVQKRFKAEGQRYEERLTKEQREELETAAAARDWNGGGAARQLTDALDHGWFDRAEDEQLKAWEQALADSLTRVRQQIRDRASKRPAKKGLPDK